MPGPPDSEPLEWSRKVGEVAFHVFWQLAPSLGPSAVLEAHFLREFAAQKVLALSARPTEIFLSASPAITHQRHWSRVEAGERHQAHVDYRQPELHQIEAALAAWSPLDLGGPLLCLDTTDGVDVDGVVEWVGSQAPEG